MFGPCSLQFHILARWSSKHFKNESTQFFKVYFIKSSSLLDYVSHFWIILRPRFVFFHVKNSFKKSMYYQIFSGRSFFSSLPWPFMDQVCTNFRFPDCLWILKFETYFWDKTWFRWVLLVLFRFYSIWFGFWPFQPQVLLVFIGSFSISIYILHFLGILWKEELYMNLNHASYWQWRI